MMSDGGAPPISVSSSYPIPSSGTLSQAAVDVAGAVPLAPLPCSSGELAGDEVWDLG